MQAKRLFSKLTLGRAIVNWARGGHWTRAKPIRNLPRDLKPSSRAKLLSYKPWDLDLEATGSHAWYYVKVVRMQCERTRKAEASDGEMVLAASEPTSLTG